MLFNHKRMRKHGCLQTTQRSNICLKLSITSLPKSSIKWIQLLLRFQLQLRLKPAARSPTLSMMLKEKLLGLGADRRQRNWKAWLSMAVVMVWQQHKSSLLFIQAFPNGLNNIRKKHQKEVATRTMYGTTQMLIRVSRLSSFVVL